MQSTSTPSQRPRTPSPQTPAALWALTALSVAVILIAVIRVFWFTPQEMIMGAVQKVFYFHLSSAWVGALAFLVAAVSGVAYLSSRKAHWDAVELASIEIGTTFSLITVLSGMSWARPIWNTWWTWDPRLTTTAIMLLIYLVYLLLRRSVDDPGLRARFSAVYAVLGFLSVPVTFLSIRMLRTIHPVLFGAGDSDGGSMGLTAPMLLTLYLSLFAFTMLYCAILWHRVRLERMIRTLEDRIDFITE
ncbi:MAG: cytochrome c biogenesis protein CcsA [Anaerolineales bacterium]|nr:cytochrome c biogenesis protein CcsA [Anaerolineales bacterium]